MDCYGYLRVSGKSQLDGDGFPRQRASIESYALAHGHSIVRWFEERAIAGKTELEHRPALQELMLSLSSSGVRTIIIEKLDRLARDLMVQETIVGDIRTQGFELVSVCEPDLCSDDPSRVLVRQMFGAVSQYEKTMIVLKLRAARVRIRTNAGRCEGRKPFGHTPEEQSIIRTMVELRATGTNDYQIARTLNTAGIRPRKAALWSSAVIGRILARV